MKKILLSLLVFCYIIPYTSAQVSMIGTALSSEIDMAQFGLYSFQQQATFTTGNIKFRQGHSWDVNWGNSTFPSGTGYQNGPDIPVTAGTYIVSFNSGTGQYNFEPTTPTPIISIVGTGVNGWPPTTGPEIILNTTDGITYSINNLAVTNGLVKFRQDYSWTTNWGGNTFPSGTGTQNGNDIPTVAGTYNVTINISNGTYTFINSNSFPIIGLWGTAVDSQNGFGGDDVEMTTTDGIIYTLSGFYFSSGNAYFRENNSSTVYGSTAFPTGIATLTGPTIFIPGGEWFVTFNRNTGEYSFTYPSIGILGSALGGFGVDDTDLITTDGFNYSLTNMQVITGELKFRKDNLWTTNWGSTAFPTGTGTQDGPNIPISGGVYNVTFERTSGNYFFTNALSIGENSISNVKVFPNPSQSNWNVSFTETIDEIVLIDSLGKLISSFTPNSTSFEIKNNTLPAGIYFVKIKSRGNFSIQKVIKN